jgi:hypothetical protein
MSAQPEGSESAQDASTPVRAVWGDPGNTPVLAANQFLIQSGNLGAGLEALILVVGHVSPPMVTTPAELAAARAAGEAPIDVLARFSVPPQQIRELAGLFARVVEQLDEKEGERS